jgi:very-short-patch-repair endonuclease
MALEHERLSSLIQFAQASAALKGSPTCDVASHPFYEHEHSLQGLPGLHFNVGGEEEEIWLAVERLHESPAPAPKQPLLALWLDVFNNPAKEPSLKSAIEFAKLLDGGFAELEEGHEPVDVKRLVLLQDFDRVAEVEAQLKAYMATQWTPWATEEKKRRRTIQLYGRLFTLKQQLEGSIIDAQIEIAMGVGMAVWMMAGVRVCYPLVTRLTDIQVNETTMAIEIRPRDIEARLELDIFTAADNPGTAELEKAYKDFKPTQTFSPFDSGTFDGILRSAVAALDSKAIYWPGQTIADDRKLPAASEELKITDTWVLVARPRSKSLFVQDLERFKKALEDETSPMLPKAIKAVLTEPATSNADITLPIYRGISTVHGHEGPSGGSGKVVADLYFPMPFNDEQVRIVQMLECHDGVVVQGPPGTGKTHTIANIIAHYFALGKRVLVTSMKEPALAVLRDKLPEEIRPLAISLLSNEQEGTKQFEYAIGKIAAEIQTIDRIAYKKDIAQLEQGIDALHARLAGIDRQITGWAKKNLQPIVMDEESISPVDAAKEVVKGQGQYEWLEDKLTPANKSLFSNSDVARLREARRSAANDMDYLGAALPEMASFPDSRDLVRMHQDLSRHAEIEAAVDAGDLPPLADSKDETIQTACVLTENIKTLFTLAQQIESAEVEWAKSARKLFIQRASSLAPVIEILDALGAELGEAVAQRNAFVAKPVNAPAGVELDEDVVQAIQNKVNGKTAFGLKGLIGKSAAKKKLEEIRVLADRPETEEDWQHVHAYVMLQRRFRELVTRWNGVAPELAMGWFDVVEPAYALKAADYFALHMTIRKHIDLEAQVIAESKELLPTWIRHSEITGNTERLQELQQFLDSHILRHGLASAWAGKEQLQRMLSNYEGGIIESLKTFAAEKLGNPSVSDADMQAKWSSLMDELKRLRGLQGAFADISDITGKIEQSGAKKWAENLRAIPANNTIDILLPDHWQTAWRLRRLTTYLETADAREELKKLAHQRTDAEILLAKTYRNIVAKRTWLKLAENATPDIRSALEAFRTAIAKIGKGTGKRAVRYRQDARKAASRANRAIPCWIMPHWRISESLPPDFGCFDLVIIDEASQSDLSALPALLRAEKVLIVGDDKQVSPDGVGLEEEKIRNLMARYLANQVEHFRAQMTPERSIYDLFKVVFAQSSTMLKEHFRCVGPIIEYSKREFYNHELKPVRLPKVSERLDPPLVDVLVEDGFRSDKADINLPEARFIVDEIKKICAEPTMHHRTIGVVSLLADKQALKIWEMLEDELGPEEIGRHQIACGDARTFQGKERDIMFLSMVVSPRGAHAQTRESIAQRFNVAASRARDRMYLVRSIELDQLSLTDKLRKNLISHFATPYMQDEQRVEDLRLRCESDFEREMYDVLIERGYRVIPQVKVGEYRIDMVVEGNNDTRLAIECDGDQYHGADRWEYDMHRQRILERVGWPFWRCFASTFVKNRKDVIEDLIASLTERGIDPIGSDTAPRSLHTEQRRVVAFPILEESSGIGNSSEDSMIVAG